MPKLSYKQLDEHLALIATANGSLGFTNEVRRAVARWQPAQIIVQLPLCLDELIRQSLHDLPKLQLISWKAPSDQEIRFISNDPCDPRIEAARLAIENNLDLEFVDTAEAEKELSYLPLPDHGAVEVVGAAAFMDAYIESKQGSGITQQHRVLAHRIHSSVKERRTLAVVTANALPALWSLLNKPTAIEEADEETEEVFAQVLDARQDLLSHVLSEIPWITWLYEQFRPHSDIGTAFPLTEALTTLLRQAANQYRVEYDEEINLTEWRAMHQYGRNLSLVRGQLRPSLYELVTCAKGCVGDDYGAIVLEHALKYPPNDMPHEEDKSKRKSLNLYLDIGDGLRRAEPAYPCPGMGTLEFNFKRRRPTPLQKERWQEEFFDQFMMTMCSWPPEDERIENFFHILRKRAQEQVSAEHTIVEEFSSSMMDGLDFRETMRNWHKKKLYVRRERTPPGKVGPVVLVWHDFPLAVRDLWKVTFYAEHQNESDIAFYCAPLGKEMSGPMISRTEYHGIMSVYPARGIPDVWQIAELYGWRSCARLLLASAILLCEEKYVAYIGPKPPEYDLVGFARSLNVGIIYLPLTSFSKKTLKRLRKVHVLGSKAARGWAGDYID